ncbi:MAG: glycosyltransferase family 4 protein [Sandaracinaceae bacterium]
MGPSPIRVLGAAYAAVPSASVHSAAMESMIAALRAELDLVTLKTEDLPHVKRIADARMFRVPVTNASREERRQLYMRAVARQLDAEPYHVVHAMDPWAGQVAATHARRRSSAALVYEVLTLPDPEERDEWVEAHRATLAAATRVIVSCNAHAKALRPRTPYDVVRPAVDVGVYDMAEPHTYAKPRILYLGPYGASRDLATVIEAVGKIRAVRPVHVLFAGDADPERKADLRLLVKRAHLEDTIEVRGEPKAHALPSVIGACDVFIASARPDLVDGLGPLPFPLLEPMACARAVVVADVPGVSELVRDEVEGLLYPAGTAGALADAVLEVLRDADLRERIRLAGYQRVRDELATGGRRRRIRAVYESIIPGSQGRDPWAELAEEPSALMELSDSQIELIEGETSAAPDDATSPRAPAPEVAPEPEKPKREEGPLPRVVARRPPRRPASDTLPALQVPDTDPGRDE